MYLKAIYDIESERGNASVTEIADRLMVKAPSVTAALQRLSELGMVRYEKYRAVRLTQKGRREARRLNRTYHVFSDLFRQMGVPEDIADEDACAIEHAVHEETLRHVEALVDFLGTANGRRFLQSFRRFMDKRADQ